MDPILFIGRSQQRLGLKLADSLAIKPGRCRIEDFADGEIRVEIKEDLTGREAWLLQSTDAPAGRNLLELLLADACRRRGARLEHLPIKRIITTDSVAYSCTSRLPIKKISLAQLLADAMRELFEG